VLLTLSHWLKDHDELFKSKHHQGFQQQHQREQQERQQQSRCSLVGGGGAWELALHFFLLNCAEGLESNNSEANNLESNSNPHDPSNRSSTTATTTSSFEAAPTQNLLSAAIQGELERQERRVRRHSLSSFSTSSSSTSPSSSLSTHQNPSSLRSQPFPQPFTEHRLSAQCALRCLAAALLSPPQYLVHSCFSNHLNHHCGSSSLATTTMAAKRAWLTTYTALSSTYKKEASVNRNKSSDVGRVGGAAGGDGSGGGGRVPFGRLGVVIGGEGSDMRLGGSFL
jgi:hypothetical protein